ncbi:MAG: hypothetical protein LBC61_00835 [Candidatus Peribacteria bacterium]|jgi:putative N6-adenine-specific DNA methylase|nr:hypothetical protein [Candidatus Peribacteria bacterium]
MIDFKTSLFVDLKIKEENGTLVSNPPYGDRLKPDNLRELYIDIDRFFRQHKNLN